MKYKILEVSMDQVKYIKPSGYQKVAFLEMLIDVYEDYMSKKDKDLRDDPPCLNCGHRRTAHSCGGGITCCDCPCKYFVSPWETEAPLLSKSPLYDMVRLHIAKAYRYLTVAKKLDEPTADYLREALTSHSGITGAFTVHQELMDYGKETD